MTYWTRLMTSLSLYFIWENSISLRGEICELGPAKTSGVVPTCLPRSAFTALISPFSRAPTSWNWSGSSDRFGIDAFYDINPQVQKHSSVYTDSISISATHLKSVKSVCLLETYRWDCQPICIWGKDSECDPTPVHLTSFLSSWLPSATGL